MSFENLSLSPVPIAEDCAQVGWDSYRELAKLECKVFIEQLRRTHGEEPRKCGFVIKANPHDFGTYYDVEVSFDENDEEASDYAYKVEGNLPHHWDELAKDELISLGYPIKFQSV
jgi:hypothetical protein